MGLWGAVANYVWALVNQREPFSGWKVFSTRKTLHTNCPKDRFSSKYHQLILGFHNFFLIIINPAQLSVYSNVYKNTKQCQTANHWKMHQKFKIQHRTQLNPILPFISIKAAANQFQFFSKVQFICLPGIQITFGYTLIVSRLKISSFGSCRLSCASMSTRWESWKGASHMMGTLATSLLLHHIF